MTAFLALVRKDLLLFSRDRRSLIMSFVAPILIASFFGYVLGNPRPKGEAARITVGFVDEDASAVTRAIAAKLAKSDGVAVRPMARAEAAEAVRGGKLTLAVMLPKGFSEAAGRTFFRADLGKPEVEVLYDPSRSAERQMVEGVLTGVVMEAVSAEVFTGASAAPLAEQTLRDIEKAPGMPESQRAALRSILKGVQGLESKQGGAAAGGGFQGMSVPFQVKAEAAVARKGQEYDGIAHSFAGMGVQFILFMGIEAGVALLLQRRQGLWRRYRSSPVSRSALLGSRALSSAILSMTILIVMFAFARVVFGSRIQGSLAGFAMVGVAFSLMTAAFGLLIAALGGTPEATRPVAVMVTLLMVMLGGSWIPVFLFPAWLQTATLVMPTRWVVDALDAMTWRGLGFEAAIAPTLVTLGFTIVFGLLAFARFRWDAD